ncbi:MAG TPA: class D sortase [Bryobacteraceae bacterium]|nr:class D sortase [Bryobacteraceae bacterium]
MRSKPPPALRILAREGSPLIRMTVPRLSLSVMVSEGVQSQTLARAAGHIPGTAFPDEPGNVGIAGHRDTFFRKLSEIRKDDVISLATPDGSYQYSVEWTRVVMPSQIDVLESSNTSALTLVTCYPFTYVGSAPERFIVRARRLD